MNSARFLTAVTFLVILFPMFSTSGPQTRYSQIRLHVASNEEVRYLASLGLALDDGRWHRGSSLDLFVSERELRVLRSNGIPFTVLVSDWHQQNRLHVAEDQARAPRIEGTDGLHNFRLGAMGGYFTLSEVVAELDSMHLRYPLLAAAKDSIGTSGEGRTIWALKISWDPSSEKNQPRALYTALHHAREPIGMMQLIYFMWYLLDNYGIDEQVTSILNTRELTFVPVVNPDGYAFNELTNPEGGGMWRKNRRRNVNGSLGVDLNRNYDYQWGIDNIGSNNNGNTETYRGPAPFSEPETRALRDLCVARKFSVALNYHAYGNLLLYPWGYTNAETPDSTFFRQAADDMTEANYFASGRGGELLYLTNGGSDDWLYGETRTKPSVMAMTPEVGSDEDGFWPVPSRILPLSRAALPMNLALAEVAGPFITVAEVQREDHHGPDTTDLEVRFVNKGAQQPSGVLNVRLLAQDAELPGSRSYAVPWGADQTLAFKALRPNGVSTGSRAQIVVDMSYKGGSSRDSVAFRHGRPVEVMRDDADSVRQEWVSTSNQATARWDTTSVSSWSGRYAYSDSPHGDYPPNLSSSLTLKQPLWLDGVSAELRFRARWNIEPGNDFAMVEISTNGGQSWESLSGKYTRVGSGAQGGKQLVGLFGYDRIKTKWVEEVIDLTAYLGKTVSLRFRLESSPSTQSDGILIDDIRILTYPVNRVTALTHTAPDRFLLEQNYPNPFNPMTHITFEIGTGGWVTLKAYDLLGREVATVVNAFHGAGRYTVGFDGSDLRSGIYFYRLTTGSRTSVKKMIVLK